MPHKNSAAIEISTAGTSQLIDITQKVASFVRSSGVTEGVCYVYVPHTTAAVTINENADPSVRSDIIKGLNIIVSEKAAYEHSEGNSPAHIKSSIIGNSSVIFIKKGELFLGRWQGIYFCEFDGPRVRRIHLKALEG